jgi:hypothetical protein
MELGKGQEQLKFQQAKNERWKSLRLSWERTPWLLCFGSGSGFGFGFGFGFSPSTVGL